MKWLQRAISIGICSSAALAANVYAATITVNNTGDGSVAGQCTLRDAIDAANTNGPVSGCVAGSAGADTIVFSLPSNSVITMGNNSFDYWITESLTIDGAGASGLAIDGNRNNRTKRIIRADTGNNVAPSIALSISNVTLRNAGIGAGEPTTLGGGAIYGKALQSLTLNTVVIDGTDAAAGAGGCISVHDTPTVTLNFTSLQNCTARDGAGLSVRNPNAPTLVNTISISGSRFTDNSAPFRGGAIGLQGLQGTILNVAESYFARNASRYNGAALSAEVTGNAVFTITDSTFENNTTVGSQSTGGTLSISGDGALTTTIHRSTVNGNLGDTQGGALILAAGTFTINQSTLSGNRINGGVGGGGGISIFNGTLHLNNSTLTGNAAPSENFHRGGGALYIGDGGIAHIRSSILANSINGAFMPVNPAYDITRYRGTPSTNALNISNSLVRNIEPGAITGTDVTNLFNADPLLGPLTTNGGLTQTHALLANSPALNTGSNPLGFTTDQRAFNYPRVNGAAADMGAVEMPTRPTITVKTVIVGTPPGSGLFVLSVTGANATGGSNPTGAVGNNGSTGAVTVDEGGTFTVAQTAAAGELLTNYTTSFTCLDAFNNSWYAVTNGVNSVTMSTPLSGVQGARTITCTFTNTAKPTLRVSTVGTGTGTVSSSPAGINCGATCSSVFPADTPVTLTANASPGSTFIGWVGGGCSGTNACVVTVASAVAVSARFELTIQPPAVAVPALSAVSHALLMLLLAGAGLAGFAISCKRKF
jgi:hypothetical protein